MATSSFDSIWSLGSTRLVIGVGSTIALFVQPGPGQVNMTLKYFSGGTLEILNCLQPNNSPMGPTLFVGSTLSQQQLATASGTGYIMGTSEVLAINGHASFYLSSLSATTIVMALVGRGENY